VNEFNVMNDMVIMAVAMFGLAVLFVLARKYDL
jgi:hypothetical protein